MKNFNTLLSLIIFAALIATLILVAHNAIELNKTINSINELEHIKTSSNSEADISEEDTEDTSSEEYVYVDPLTVTDFSDEGLAIIVSNKDYPREEIEIIAKNNGYEDYTDLCNHLIKQGLLVVIPEYVHPEYGLMHSNIVTPDTVAYHLAVEAGAIKEVQ